MQARFAAVSKKRKNQDMVTMLPPLPVQVPLVGTLFWPYSRPVQNIIVGVSPACNSFSLKNCEFRLHDMTASYKPMIQTLYDVAIKKSGKKD